MKTLKDFFRKETVFCVSFLLALISAAAVRPDPAYLTYPDYRTLALLFCFMIIVAGFQWLGVFSLLGETLLKKASSLRNLSVLMVLLCFFSSMIITKQQGKRPVIRISQIGRIRSHHRCRNKSKKKRDAENRLFSKKFFQSFHVMVSLHIMRNFCAVLAENPGVTGLDLDKQPYYTSCFSDMQS